MTSLFYGLLALFSVLIGSWCQSFVLTSPIEGVEGTNVTFYCITTSQRVQALGLSVEVNGVALPTSRGSTNDLNDTHKEVTLHNLDRRPFVNFNQPGDNGMPLYCTFSSENSNLVRVQVFYFDYAELSQQASGDEVVWIEQGLSREISLNVSAGPTTESVISRVDGSEVSSQISINQSIAVTQAGREISGTYNATFSNLAGSASFLVNIQVFAAPSFTSTAPQFCEATDNTSSTLKCSVRERMNVTLGCQHEAYPQATLRVTFNGSNITTAGTNVALENGDIVIRSFDRSRNTGQYKCFASNTVEGDTRSTSITYELNVMTTTSKQLGIRMSVFLLMSEIILLSLIF